MVILIPYPLNSRDPFLSDATLNLSDATLEPLVNDHLGANKLATGNELESVRPLQLHSAPRSRMGAQPIFEPPTPGIGSLPRMQHAPIKLPWVVKIEHYSKLATSHFNVSAGIRDAASDLCVLGVPDPEFPAAFRERCEREVSLIAAVLQKLKGIKQEPLVGNCDCRKHRREWVRFLRTETISGVDVSALTSVVPSWA